MNIQITALFALFFLTGCTTETTKSTIKETHNIASHINRSDKLGEAEFELISESPFSFQSYQPLGYDPRSSIVSNLRQHGEKKTYLVGDGFFLIDEGFVLRSSRPELVATLVELTLKPKEGNRYSND